MDEKEKDFLEGMTETVEPEAPEKAEPETPEPAKGEEPAKPEPEASPAPEPKKEDTVPLAAMIAERKGKQAERELRQKLERELAEIKAKQQQEQAPDFYEAPDKYVNHVLQQREQQLQQRMLAALEEQARETFPDYDEVFAEVEEHCKANPAQAQSIMASANPALAAYKFGKQLREQKAMQDPEAYKAKLKAEVLAELQAEQAKAKEEAKRKAADTIPPDLATARSAHSGEPAVESVFDDIFKT